MNRLSLTMGLLGAMILGPTGLFAAEEPAPLVSGLQVGADTPAFDVINVAGPYEGQTLCIC